MYYRYLVSRVAAVLAIVALGAAAWFSIRLAQADADFRRRTPESVARAVELAPRNTEYLALRALQLDYDGVDATPVRYMDNGEWKDGKGGPWNSFFFFDDPDGNSFAVQEKPE